MFCVPCIRAVQLERIAPKISTNNPIQPIPIKMPLFLRKIDCMVAFARLPAVWVALAAAPDAVLPFLAAEYASLYRFFCQNRFKSDFLFCVSFAALFATDACAVLSPAAAPAASADSVGVNCSRFPSWVANCHFGCGLSFSFSCGAGQTGSPLCEYCFHQGSRLCACPPPHCYPVQRYGFWCEHTT